MKWRFSLLLLVSMQMLQAQNCPQGFLGTKTLYPVPTQKTTTPPNGFAPLLLNHVGRHGARHLTKMPSASVAYRLLKKAGSTGALTEKGRRLQTMIEQLDAVETNKVELISATGAKEQQGIAGRMVKAYPQLFGNDSLRLRITVAKKKRTLQTAEAFLTALGKRPFTSNVPKPVNDTTLRFYDLSPAYLVFQEEGEWKARMQELKTRVDVQRLAEIFASQFFKPGFLKAQNVDDCETFTDDIYGFAVILPSLGEEIKAAGFRPGDIDFSTFFACSQVKVLAAVNEAEDFFLKGPGSDANGIQVRIAAPLLTDFIRTTDAALNGAKPSVFLRFAHAETVAPFAALLGLKGASEASTGPNMTTTWKAAGIVPLSANIQWIVYGNSNSKSHLIKFLLNEKEVAVNGLKPYRFPFYWWEDVRRFYIQKLTAMGTGLNENGYQYLLRVKNKMGQ